MSEQIRLCWVTGGARDCLGESTAGLIANALEYGHDVSVMIAVDSDEPARLERVSGCARKATTGTAVPTQVINLATVRAFLSADELSGIRNELEYGLVRSVEPVFPGNSGVNHNALMLACAGRPYVVSDDDVFAWPAAVGDRDIGRAAGPIATDEHQPARLRFCRDRREAMGMVTPLEADLVGLHHGVLGCEMGGPDENAGQHAKRVVYSSTGSYGDCGMGSPRAILTLEGDDRAAIACEDDYRALRLTRELVRIAERACVGRGTHLMAMNIGLDNRRPLPPFLSKTRNADGLVSVLTRIIYPDSVSYVHEVGLLHSPPEPRAFVLEQLRSWRPWPGDLLMGMVVAMAGRLGTDEPVERMKKLGRELEFLGTLRPSEFVEAVHQRWLATAIAYLSRLEGVLERYGNEPVSWAEDVVALIGDIEEKAHDGRLLFGEQGCGLLAGELGEQCRRYGLLLQVWPQAWDVARREQLLMP